MGPLETTLNLKMHQKGILVHRKYYRLHHNSLKEVHQPSDISVLHQENDDQFSGIHFNVSNDLLCQELSWICRYLKTSKHLSSQDCSYILEKSGYHWPDFGVFFGQIKFMLGENLC